MVKASVVIDVRNMPEVVWTLRHEMAKILREVADAEVSNSVAARLREVADRFEAGQ